MNDFLTLDMLKVFVVAVSITVVLTEFSKEAIDWIFKKLKMYLPTKYVVFFFAIVVIFLPIVFSEVITIEIVATGILNAVLLTLTAMKSYETILERVIARVYKDQPPADALE